MREHIRRLQACTRPMFEFPAIPHRSPPTIEIMALVKYLLDIVRARWGCMGFVPHLVVGPRLHRCFGSIPARPCLFGFAFPGLKPRVTILVVRYRGLGIFEFAFGRH